MSPVDFQKKNHFLYKEEGNGDFEVGIFFSLSGISNQDIIKQEIISHYPEQLSTVTF